jgi:hypothetical protein
MLWVQPFTSPDALGLRALTLRLQRDSACRTSPGSCEGSTSPGLATDSALGRVELGRGLGGRFSGVAAEALAYAATYLEPMVQVPPRGIWDERGRGAVED